MSAGNGNLLKIYSKIPNFNCKHCHECCGPIIWFRPEEILIENYLKTNKIKRIVWSEEEFKKNNMKCPYLLKNKCIIYPVRPIVCRLQGNIDQLKCKCSVDSNYLSQKELDKIKKDFFKLVEKTDDFKMIYITKKFNFF